MLINKKIRKIVQAHVFVTKRVVTDKINLDNLFR